MMVMKMAANSARWGGDREDEKRRWRRTVRGGVEIGKMKKEDGGEQCEVGWR